MPHSLTFFLGEITVNLPVVVEGEKVSFPTNKIYVGSGSLNQNSMMGLMYGPKAIFENNPTKNSLAVKMFLQKNSPAVSYSCRK